MGNTYRSKQHRKAKNKEVSIRCLFSKYRNRAKKINAPFSITIDTFASLIFQKCYICGQSPRNKLRQMSGKGVAYGVLIYNGVDRIDNSLGYIDGNVMPCCAKCNSMKSKMSHDDFKKHIKKIAKHIAGRLKWW